MLKRLRRKRRNAVMSERVSGWTSLWLLLRAVVVDALRADVDMVRFLLSDL